MSGLTSLKETLSTLNITCDGIVYGFASVADNSGIAPQEVLATFQEDDKLAIIAPKSYLESQGIGHEGPYAKLTIEAHTSLELVGLTAALATRLAEHDIAANVVAAFYHDHVFVPYALRAQAISLLEGLKDS